MPRSCEGRIAIVTGASRGIGQAVAVRLAAEGAGVALVGRGERARSTNLAGSLAETAQMIEALGGVRSPLVVHADIANDDKAPIVAGVGEHFGAAPDVLMHVAAAPREFGGGKPSIPFAETPREWFQRTVDVNVWSMWDFARAMVPGMRTRGAGWIVSISSLQAQPRPMPTPEMAQGLGGACIYGGTKAFLDRVTTGAAQELYPDNIAVNCISPTGPVQTPLSSTVVSSPGPLGWEPMETMVEAALAGCTMAPRELTSRVAFSLPLLFELDRTVYSLDGRERFAGWQPGTDDPRKHLVGYLAGH